MKKESIHIDFKNGHSLEIGEKTFDNSKLTLEDHFYELRKAKAENKSYVSGNVYIMTEDINFILLTDKTNN